MEINKPNRELRKIAKTAEDSAPQCDPSAKRLVDRIAATRCLGYEQPPRLFDRDAKFSADVISTVKQNGTEPVRTAFRSPWQNGIAERWVGSVRRDLLDHVIVLNQPHLRRLLKNPDKVVCMPLLGGLHHRYTVAA